MKFRRSTLWSRSSPAAIKISFFEQSTRKYTRYSWPHSNKAVLRQTARSCVSSRRNKFDRKHVHGPWYLLSMPDSHVKGNTGRKNERQRFSRAWISRRVFACLLKQGKYRPACNFIFFVNLSALLASLPLCEPARASQMSELSDKRLQSFYDSLKIEFCISSRLGKVWLFFGYTNVVLAEPELLIFLYAIV